MNFTLIECSFSIFLSFLFIKQQQSCTFKLKIASPFNIFLVLLHTPVFITCSYLYSLSYLDMSSNRAPQCVIQNGRKKITTTNGDGSQVHEEYDVITDELLLRKYRRAAATALGAECPWVVEVGVDEGTIGGFREDRDLIRERNDQPILSRTDEKDSIVLRIRNLPYDVSNYVVSIEERVPQEGGRYPYRIWPVMVYDYLTTRSPLNTNTTPLSSVTRSRCRY